MTPEQMRRGAAPATRWYQKAKDLLDRVLKEPKRSQFRDADANVYNDNPDRGAIMVPRED
jgi:hypothetical protein